MICLVRIKGNVGIRKDVEETLKRIKLGKKYSCTVLNPKKDNSGIIKKLKDHVAFGEIKDEVFEKLVEKRGHAIDAKKKIDAKKIVEGIKNGKTYQELNLKSFFRLHPPRGGIDSKIHFGKKEGVLGNNGEKINELVERML